ncbi:MAG TPA: MFS transporter, partial [Puia sp.]
FISPLVYSGIVLNLKQNNPNGGILSALGNHVPTQLPWISMYWLFTIICLLMILILLFSRFPKVELKTDEKAGALKIHIDLFKKRIVILFFISMLCYVGTEQGVANWISQFLFTYHNYDPQKAGAETVAYFWGMMTAGGLLGLFLVKLMDSRRVLIIFSVLAIACLSAGLFGSGKISLIAFPMVGFFASVMYPIIFSLALNSLDEHHGSFSGILVTGIVGGAIIPLVIGWLGDHFGLRSGMCFLYLTLGFILSIGFWAKPIIRNKTIRLFDRKKNPQQV